MKLASRMFYPFLIIKFSKKKHLEKLQDGLLHLKLWNYYRYLEHPEQGDINEGVTRWMNPDKTKMIINGYELSSSGGTINGSITSENKRIKVFCASMISENEDKRKDNKIFDDRIKTFGDSFLVITNVYEFLKRLQSSLKILQKRDVIINYAQNKITYFDPVIYDGPVDPFMKVKKYSHQKEWRLVVETFEENESIDIKFPSITDISYLGETKDFKNIVKKDKRTNNYIWEF